MSKKLSVFVALVACNVTNIKKQNCIKLTFNNDIDAMLHFRNDLIDE